MFGEHGRYIGNIITFGDELAFHRRGLCVSGSAHVTILSKPYGYSEKSRNSLTRVNFSSRFGVSAYGRKNSDSG